MEQSKRHRKFGLHSRNRHKGHYNFELLKQLVPELSEYVYNNRGIDTIDFSNPEAVKLLNQGLLKQYYKLEYWKIPDNYLVPPIPGRGDYIHFVADLLRDTASKGNDKIPRGRNIRVLDIGVGANCIYPIIGCMEYDWYFVGSETDDIAFINANEIVESNKKISRYIEIRKQKSNNIFYNIIKSDEFYDLSICNPPFHSSETEAQKSNLRKIKGIKAKSSDPKNFGGISNELWCEGGEKEFVNSIILESKEFESNCLWFTTLVSKESNLNTFYKQLKSIQVDTYGVYEMNHANKKARILYWSFLKQKQREKWISIKLALNAK
ncbi:MAG: 23S rRNA (adenine(1618)-N(6))-methyltransferase RlmF [Marinilabiliales bacterium]|nr:MAG: 23S rRNA (adenine(1618)-N(6))-methyltransferase RlmF [Marinilabiliales bacterium]